MAHAWEKRGLYNSFSRLVYVTHHKLSLSKSDPHPRFDCPGRAVPWHNGSPYGREALVRHLRTMTTFCGKCCWHSRTASNGTGVV